MMKVETVHKKGPNSLAKLLQRLRKQETKGVYVGVPEETNTSRGQHNATIDNARLMAIHEEGSPIKGIPPRPAIRIGINESQHQAGEYIAQANKLAGRGKGIEADQQLEKAGHVAEESIKRVFGSSKLEPLKPATVARRKMGSAAPLIDTGVLRNSIRYVIREEGKKKK